MVITIDGREFNLREHNESIVHLVYTGILEAMEWAEGTMAVPRDTPDYIELMHGIINECEDRIRTAQTYLEGTEITI